jgi:hypothetical protein
VADNLATGGLQLAFRLAFSQLCEIDLPPFLQSGGSCYYGGTTESDSLKCSWDTGQVALGGLDKDEPRNRILGQSVQRAAALN